MNGFKDEMIMSDKLEKIGKGSVVHHGKSNDRIYLMKLLEADYSQIIPLLDELALRHGYSKIFCKIPSKAAPLFIASGFVIESYIPRFYEGKEGAFFVSRFLSDERSKPVAVSAMRQLFDLLQTPLKPKPLVEEKSRYSICRLGKDQVDAMAEIYGEVFESYPFAIHDPAYLAKTMDEDIHYFGAFKEGQLVALSSSEIDKGALNAEMTDFATHPRHLGNGLSHQLLAFMEQNMHAQGIKTVYTIARLNSISMNKTFVRSGYAYSGTLRNNTQIAGEIESMNVYYKILDPA